MRIRKILGKDAEQTLKKYRDESGLIKIKEEIGKTETHKEKFNVLPSSLKKLVVACTCVLIIGIGVSLFCGLYFGLPTEQTNPTCFDENQATAISDLEELNRELHYLQIENIATVSSVTRYYDIISGDTLYYLIIFGDDETFTDITMKIVKNCYYKMNSENSVMDKTDLLGLDLVYHDNISKENELFSVQTIGFIDTDRERIHIIYYSVNTENISEFLPYLKEILIKIKSNSDISVAVFCRFSAY